MEIPSFIHKHTQRVFLVDTPGFDDSERSETQVLKDVAFFLSQIYKRKILLTGIIYLHRITDRRMSGSSVRNLDMFKALCGEDAYKHIVLATTMWENLTGPGLSYDVGVEREQELLRRQDWWGLMYKRGSQVVRHTGDKQSAMDIVEYLVALAKPVRLAIQTQLVDEGMMLEDTDAGQKYEKELNHLKKLHQEQLIQIKELYDQALKSRDTEVAEILEEQRRELEGKLRDAARKQDDLKVNLEQLAQEKSDQFNKLLAALEAEQQKTSRLVSDREADLRRFEDDHVRDRQRARDAEDQFQRDRKYLEDKLHGLEQQHQENSNAPSNYRESLLKIDEMQHVFLAQKRREDEEALQEKLRFQQLVMEAQISQRAQRQQMAAQQEEDPVYGIIAGMGTMVAGAMTVNPIMWAAGAGTAIYSATRLK